MCHRPGAPVAYRVHTKTFVQPGDSSKMNVSGQFESVDKGLVTDELWEIIEPHLRYDDLSGEDLAQDNDKGRDRRERD